MTMTAAITCHDGAVAVNNPLAEQVVERLLRLSPEKTARMLELWRLHGQSSDHEERREITKVIVEIVYPAFVDIPWSPGATGMLEEGVSRETMRKVKSYRRQVGLRVKNRRNALGMTQEVLAQKAGIPQSHVCKIEKGVHASTDTTIQRVADALGIAPSELDPAFSDELS